MNREVSVVYISEDSYEMDLFFFNKIQYAKIEKENPFYNVNEPKEFVNSLCQLEVEIIIAIRQSRANNIDERYYDLADKIIFYPNESNEAECYNELFRNCNNKYVCLFKPQVILQPLWLQDLIFSYQSIEKTGVVSIASNLLDTDFMPLLSSDNENLLGVFLPKLSYFENEGVFLFDRQLLYFVGAFDIRINNRNLPFIQFQMRTSKLGFNNYYIASQTSIQITRSNNFSVQDFANVVYQVEEMRKNKSFYIPL